MVVGIPRVQQNNEQDRDVHLHQHGGEGRGRGEVPERAEGEVQPLHHRGPDQPDETVKGESVKDINRIENFMYVVKVIVLF